MAPSVVMTSVQSYTTKLHCRFTTDIKHVVHKTKQHKKHTVILCIIVVMFYRSSFV